MNITLRVVLFTLSMPLLAGALCWGAMAKIDSDLRSEIQRRYPTTTEAQLDSLTVSSLQANGSLRSDAELPVLYGRLKFVRIASFITAGAGLLLIGGVYFAGRATRLRRELLVKLFRPGLYLTLAAVGVLTAAQAFEIAYAAYYFESIFIERVHFVLILGIALGGILAFVAVVRAMFAFLKPVDFEVLGQGVTAEQQPALWATVKEVCAQLQAAPPDNIVLGLEPSFYVTEAEVTCAQGKLQGRTLFVSLALSRVLTPAELKAVIGHEMAHFIGADTVFSQRFFPVYRGTAVALHNLQQNAVHSSLAIAQLPAVMMLAYFYEAFATSEKNLSRLRETEADATGARVAGAASLATALVKVHAYSEAWGGILESARINAEELRGEKSLARPFVEKARGLSPEALAKVGEHHIFHPTDSHPTLAVRLQSLQIEIPAAVAATAVPAFEASAAALVANVDELEASQTENLRKLLRPES